MAEDLGNNTTDYRLTRVEREVGELRSKLEAGQGAMLQAVASVSQQLTGFQLSLKEDLNRNYVSVRDFDREGTVMRERIAENTKRLDGFDSIYIKALDEARVTAETTRNEDARRTIQINVALATSILSAIIATVLHFVKV